VRVAIVHDYLNQRGGAERVLAVLHEMFPEAPIFTSVLDRSALWPELRSADIRVSWMQRLPGVRRHFKKYLLLYPLVFERLDLSGFDLVLSSSSAFAKAARAPRGGVHVCYCYTPARFLWSYDQYVEREELGRVTRAALPWAIRMLRRWDLRTAARPDTFVSISSVVTERIRRIYGREAAMVPPPVDVERFRPLSGEPGDYYLVVSRLDAYKRLHLAVEAFNRLRLPLVVVGEGPHRPVLERMAGPTVRFLGHVDDARAGSLLAGCRALIFPGEEDFGIAVLEANAAGRPVVAFHAGGTLDTVREGMTGVFFREATASALAEAVGVERRTRWDPVEIRRHAEAYRPERFRERLDAVIAACLAGRTLPVHADTKPSRAPAVIASAGDLSA
jgi:glycosyltransferase involved in cell wall biosynthesis